MFFDLQRAGMLKRVSAWLLDIIVVTILATGFGFLVSYVIGYDAKNDELSAIYASYEREYGISLERAGELTAGAGASEEELLKYQAASEAMAGDEKLTYTYTMVVNMTLVIISIGLLLAFAVSEFAVPLILKDGQTIGKKIFGLCLMQTDQMKVTTTSLAIRTFLGKYVIETMVPVLLIIMIFFGFIGMIGTIIIGLLLLLQLAIMIYTKTNSAIHDLMSFTVVVDAKSQMIFSSATQRDEYKNKYAQKDEKRGL